MKKVLLMAMISIFSISSLIAQESILPIDEATGEIVFSEVVNVDSVSSNELYLRAKQWLAVTYVSAKEVVQMDDKESGTLIAKAMIDVHTTFMMKSPCGVVKYTLTIYVKDGKYKYVVSNFWHSGDYNLSREANMKTPGDLRADKPGGGLMTMGMKNWNGIKNQTRSSIESLINSLKEAMSKKTVKDNNW